MLTDIEKFQTSLDKVNDDLNIKLNASHVGDRNSKENQDIVLLQIQKRVLENKIIQIENGATMTDSPVVEPPTTITELPVEPTLEQKLETESKLPPLEIPVTCEGEKCDNPTKDPSKLCAICKTKRDYVSRIPEHG